MIAVCFPHSYTQKSSRSGGICCFLFENLLQASRLVIHPRFHTADIIGLYGTVTDMAAVVILHSCRSHPNSRCNVIFIGYCLRRCHTYHLLLPRHGHEKSSRDRNCSGDYLANVITMILGISKGKTPLPRWMWLINPFTFKILLNLVGKMSTDAFWNGIVCSNMSLGALIIFLAWMLVLLRRR